MKIEDFDIEPIVDKHGKSVLKDEVRLRNLLCDYNPRESISLEDVRKYLHSTKNQSAIQYFLNKCRKPRPRPQPTPPPSAAPPAKVQTGFCAGKCNLNPIAVSIDTSKPNTDFK